jgi:catechol 2,3-dioxygenase-like lactoylglutathione lyase family enzyme
MKIGSIVIHCHDFDRTVAFWQAALHYVPREPAKGGWVVLRDPEDKGPNLSFQGRDRRPRSRSWLHLDLYTADQQAEVERFVALGARRYPWRYRAGDDFIVLEDPGGALFCVVQKADVPAIRAEADTPKPTAGGGEGLGWVFHSIEGDLRGGRRSAVGARRKKLMPKKTTAVAVATTPKEMR